MSDASAFRTFQTPSNYEAALSRHGQWIRWVNGVTCPCVVPTTMQPDPSCSMCKGRGKLYRNPDKFQILNETTFHQGSGLIRTTYSPVVEGSATVYHRGSELPLASPQPGDGTVKLAPPWPKQYQRLSINYEYVPRVTVTSENSEVYSSNLLRTVATRFNEYGKTFEGSVESVSRVYNASKDETYTVSNSVKEYIYLEDMGTWESGDTLEVDYTYVKPFNFVLSGVSHRIRYESPYVLDDADAILLTPYWARVAPDDLFTALAIEQIGRVVVNPTISSGNDEVTSYYDLSKLLRVIDRNGNDYEVGVGKDVEIYGRNELQWNVTKPNVSYTAQFTYHPTYIALNQGHSLRNAENKAFVNRVNVKQFDRVNSEVMY